MTATRAFRRRDHLMIGTVKATLLITALARFTVIVFGTGFRHLSQRRR